MWEKIDIILLFNYFYIYLNKKLLWKMNVLAVTRPIPLGFVTVLANIFVESNTL
jgi:hypothetical protein